MWIGIKQQYITKYIKSVESKRKKVWNMCFFDGLILLQNKNNNMSSPMQTSSINDKRQASTEISDIATKKQHCQSPLSPCRFMQDYLCSVDVRTSSHQYNVNFLVRALLPEESYNENGTGYAQIISKCTTNWFKGHGTKNYGCFSTVDLNCEGHEILFKKASLISEDLALQIMEIGTERRFEGDNEDSCMKTFELNDAENNFVETFE